MKSKHLRFLALPIVSLLLFGCTTSPKKEDIFDGTDTPVVEHQHTFSDSWSFNNQTHWHASTCEHSGIRKDEELHDFDVVETPATFEKEGKLVYTCKVCYYSETKITPVLTHNYSSSWESDRTSHWHTCSDKGYESVRKDLEDHSFVETITKPTFELDGLKEYTCSICGYSYSISIPKLTHSYSSDWDYDEHGHWHHCIDEGYTDDVVDYAIHDYEIETVSPTYEEAGRTIYTCKECEYSYYVEINPIDHNYSDKYASDDEGHWHPCIDKGYEDLKGDYEKHTFSSEVVDPTYTSEGFTVHTCEECGFKYTDEKVDKLEHHYFDKWENDAWGHWHICSDEGYDDLKIGYSSHNYDSEIAVQPTMFEAGVEKFTCEECGFTYTKKVPSFYEQCINSCDYRLVDNSYYRLFKVPENISVVYVPDEYNGLPVRQLDSHCLHSNVTELHLGRNVTSVQYYELYWYAPNIEVLELNDYFTYVPFYFYNLSKLREIYFGNCEEISFYQFSQLSTFKTIRVSKDNSRFTESDGAIYDKGMTTLYFCPRDKEGTFVLPDSVTNIYEYAFAYSGITSIDLSSVNTISNYAFAYSGITSIDLSSVTYINNYAFYHCEELNSVILPTNSNYALHYHSFEYCSNLEEITLSANPYSSSDEVFYECESISKLNIGKNVTYFPSSLFKNACITEVTIEDENNALCVKDGFLLDSSQFELYMCIDKNASNIIVPDSVQVINSFAFANCSMESIDLNNTDNSNEGCFYNCVNLKEVDLSKDCNSAYYRMFYNCQSLKRIILSENIRRLDNQCFYNCFALEEIVGLDRCTAINKGCFENCNQMIHSYGNIKYVGNPDNPYCVALGPDSDYFESDIIEFVDDCEIVASEAFSYLLTNYIIGNNGYTVKLNNVKSLSNYCFRGTSIINIDFGTSLSYIGSYAFSYTQISSLVLPDTLTTIEYCAFSNCTNLASIFIPKSVTYINEITFNYDYNITSIVVEEGSQYFEVYKNALYSINSKQLIFDFSFSDTLIVKKDTVYVNWYFLDGRDSYVTPIATIFYEHTEEEYYQCGFSNSNSYLISNAKRYFYSETPQVDCWHYVEGVPTLW